MTERPVESEYAPYYHKYIALVPDGAVADTLESQIAETLALLASIGEADGDRAYAPGKWTVKEVVGHMADTERIFTYRALRAARGDDTPLPGFDENTYVPAGEFGGRTLASLADELAAVRAATVALFRNLPAPAWSRRGVANGTPFAVRAIAWIAAGHELHHRGLFRTRYLPALASGGAAAE
ncbi:MAG: DinB-like domain protein [Gemmatimonadetes bacterium]|nr:DinB-like domain protein [Gemmatimonadota bacterium]